METEQILPTRSTGAAPVYEQGACDVSIGSITASGQAKLLQNFGTLNAQNVVFASEKESIPKLKASAILPFARDDKFVPRKGIFDQLDAALSPDNSQPWAALYGLGGIGKSQLAIEYCYRARDADPDLWVFWIACNNVESLVQSFRKVAQRLALAGHDSPQSDTLDLVEPWLSDESNGSWLMVLDNVDDIQVLCVDPDEEDEDSESKHVRQRISYIPQVSHGQVIVTSRDEETASQVVPIYESLFKVDFMDASESLALLRCRIPVRSNEESDARELVEVLDYIPLAISQAGAYIRQMRSLITIKKYLKHLKESESKQAELLQKQKQEPRRSQKVPSSILLAWAISFEQIKRRDEEAADILCLVAMLYRQNIPLEMISSKEDLRVLEIVTQLEAFSFITVSQAQTPGSTEDDKVVSLHRLIQLAVRQWLDLHGQLMKWKIHALNRVSEHLKEHETSYEQLDYNIGMSLHADEVLTCEKTTDPSTEINRALILGDRAELEYLKGNTTQYLEKAVASNEILQRHCEENDKRKWDGKLRLAAAYIQHDLEDEAESMLVELREQLCDRFGPDDYRALSAGNDLAILYTAQKRTKEAKDLLEEVVNRARATMGLNYDTLIAMNNLGALHIDLGQYDKAFDVFTQLLEVKKQRNQAEDPDSLYYTIGLANVYFYQGQHRKAEEIYRQVAAKQRERMGADHPLHLRSMSDLIINLHEQRRYEEAETLCKELISVREQSASNYRPLSGTTRNYHRVLAVIYMGQGRTDEAFDLLLETRRLLSAEEAGSKKNLAVSSIVQRTLENWLFEAMAGLNYSLGLPMKMVL